MPYLTYTLENSHKAKPQKRGFDPGEIESILKVEIYTSLNYEKFLRKNNEMNFFKEKVWIKKDFFEGLEKLVKKNNHKIEEIENIDGKKYGFKDYFIKSITIQTNNFKINYFGRPDSQDFKELREEIKYYYT
jgi:hypothetical protein